MHNPKSWRLQRMTNATKLSELMETSRRMQSLGIEDQFAIDDDPKTSDVISGQSDLS